MAGSSGEEVLYSFRAANGAVLARKSPATRSKESVEERELDSDSSDISDHYSATSCSDGASWEGTDKSNARKVTGITLNCFYQPRTLSLLTCGTVTMIYFAFASNGSTDLGVNVCTGLLAVVAVFLGVGLLVFPNGPFTRPHPAIWRLLFGLSLVYLLVLVFVLFQERSHVLETLHWLDPSLRGFEIDQSEFTPDCSFKLANIWTRIDSFIPGHFFGWMYKALIVRNWVILWANSLAWECTEIFFAHILPNFVECWWDIVLLDILICNGLGIAVGMYLVHRLEVRTYHWESIRDIRGARGKIRRAVLQFTPESWTHERWLDPSSGYMRLIAIFVLIFSIQMTDLNAFLLKRVLNLPVKHPLNFIRIVLIGLIGAPSMRQYYVFVTDRTCKRLGTQAWVFYAIMIVELLISVKYGLNVLPKPALPMLAGWFLFQFMLCCVVLVSSITYQLRKTRCHRRGPREKTHRM